MMDRATSYVQRLDPALILFVLVIIGVVMEWCGHGAELRRDAMIGLCSLLQARAPIPAATAPSKPAE